MIVENLAVFVLIPLTAFVVTYAVMPYWIKLAKRAQLVGRDHSRPGAVVAETGGVIAVFAFVFAMMLYVGVKTFYLGTLENVATLFALLSMALIVSFIGFVLVDKVLGYRLGLTKWKKPLLTLLAALPLMVLNPQHPIDFPFLGAVDFGLFYPLVLVPLGIIGAANAYNTFAGYNGLEAGMGVVIFSTMGLLSLDSVPYVSLVSFTIVGACLALLGFNWFPARVFVGDAFTYFMGAMLAAVAVLGGLEFIAVFLFLPYILDFVVYLKNFKYRIQRGLWRGVAKNGVLYPPKMGPIHLVHYPLKWFNGLREPVVVSIFLGVEAVLALIAFFVIAPLL